MEFFNTFSEGFPQLLTGFIVPPLALKVGGVSTDPLKGTAGEAVAAASPPLVVRCPLPPPHTHPPPEGSPHRCKIGGVPDRCLLLALGKCAGCMSMLCNIA